MFKTGPFQTVLCTSRGRTEIIGKTAIVDNVMTIDWHTPVSVNPALYVIAVGKLRFSLELIRSSQVFAINFLGPKFKDAVILCGSHTGKHMDKFKEAGLAKEEAHTIDCPLIEGRANAFECHVLKEIDAGDHVLIIGHITQAHEDSGESRLIHKNSEFLTI